MTEDGASLMSSQSLCAFFQFRHSQKPIHVERGYALMCDALSEKRYRIPVRSWVGGQVETIIGGEHVAMKPGQVYRYQCMLALGDVVH